MRTDREEDLWSAGMELVAKSSYVHLDEMAATEITVIMSAPALLEKHRFGDDLTHVFGEGFEQTELDWREE